MDPTGQTCLTGRDLVIVHLSIFTLQYVMGVLVQLKHTALLRTALMPMMLWVDLRTILALNPSCGS